MNRVAMAVMAASVASLALAVRPTTVYLVQHTHSDIGYARPQHLIVAHYVEQIDHVLDYCELTKDYPNDAKFRWTCEVASSVLNFLKTRPPEQVARLRHWVEQGNIEITGMYLNTGEICDEATAFHQLRELKLLREAGLSFKLLLQSDVNGLPWCLADYAADLGVKYTWMAENTSRAMRPFAIPTVYRWQSPSGRELIAFRSEHYMTGNQWGIQNGDEQAFAKKMNAFLDHLDKNGYPFDSIAIPYMGYPTDDSAPNWQPCGFIRKWNESGAHKVRLVSATASMFLDRVARDAAAVAKLPIHHAAYPDWWSDGFGSCARETGEALESQRGLGAAEGLFAMALLKGRSLPPASAPLIADTRRNLAFWGEHTVGSYLAIRDPLHWDAQAGWRCKAAFAWTALRDVHVACESASGVFAPDIARDEEHATLTLFNSLPWTRDGVADVYIDHGVIPSGSGFRIVDAKGVPLQAMRLHGGERADGCYFRIFAPALPPCGYRTYTIEVGGAYRVEPTAPALENEFYRIAIDANAGVVTSIFDKRAKRELVDPAAPHRLGEIIYETFKDRYAINNLNLYNPAKAGFTHRSCANFKRVGGERNAMFDSVKFTADFPEEGASKFSLEVRLMKERPEIELAYTLRRAKSGEPSSFYVAFPFTGRKLAFDVPGGLVHPGENQLEGTSTAWNSVQNFASAEDGNFRIVLSSSMVPLVQFGKLFARHKFEYLKKYDRPYIYSWPMNNYWWTNFVREQNGDFNWSYNLTTQQDAGAEGAFRWALAKRVPLLARVQTRGAANGRPREWRGLELGSDALVVNALTPALDGKGVVMAVGERSGKTATLTLKGPDGNLLRFRRIDALERPLGDFTTSLPIKPFENLIIYFSPQSPISQSPISQSKINQSEINQSPISQSKINQSEINQSPISQSKINQSKQSKIKQSKIKQSKILQSSVTPYRFLRFKVEETKGAANGTQISELQLFEDGKDLRGEIVRAFADDQVTDAEGRKYRENQTPAQALDGVLISKWFDYRGNVNNPVAVRDAVWMGVEFKRPVKVTGYAWISAEDYPERDPASWRLQGSNDGKTWVDVHVVRGYRASDMRNVRAYCGF